MNDNAVKRHLDHAEGYAALRMYDDALAEVAPVLACRPDHKDALYLRGLIQLEQRNLVDSEAAFRRLVELDPEQAHVYVHLAYIHRRTVSLERAVETISRALALKPSMPIALYNLACYRAVQGDTSESLRLLAQAVQQSKKYRDLARNDPDFDSLRGNVEFHTLLNPAET